MKYSSFSEFGHACLVELQILDPSGRRRQFMQRKLHGKLMRKEARGGKEVKNQPANSPISPTYLALGQLDALLLAVSQTFI